MGALVWRVGLRSSPRRRSYLAPLPNLKDKANPKNHVENYLLKNYEQMKILPLLIFTIIEGNRIKREPLKSLTCKHDRDTVNVGERKYIESQHYPRKSTEDKFCRWTIQDRSFIFLELIVLFQN